MDYIPLTSLDNQYPNVANYTKSGTDKVLLSGKYPANSITFKQPNLDAITPVANTSFRFILKIDNKYYTSKKYWDDLQKSILDTNPYFTQESVKNYNIVELNTDGMLTKFSDLHTKENVSFVDMSLNTYIDKINGIEYTRLVQYIDWLTSPVDTSLIENGGVLYWNELCTYSNTKPVVVNGDVVPIEIKINNVNDPLLEGIVYFSKCEEKYVWPFEHLNKPTRYEWINGDSISITNNTTQSISLNMTLDGTAETKKVFKLSHPSITLNANSTRDISVVSVNRFEIDKVYPKLLWNGESGGTGNNLNNYDTEYYGDVTIKSPTLSGAINLPLKLRKQSGGTWNENTARKHKYIPKSLVK